MFSPATQGVAVGAAELGDARHDRQLAVAGRHRPQTVVGRGLHRLHRDQHRRALVLDGLEGADRPAELLAQLGVLDRHLQRPLRSAGLFRGEADGRDLEHPADRGPGVVHVTDEPRRYQVEVEPGLLAGLVHGGQRLARQAVCIAFDREHAHAAVGARHRQDQPGADSVGHVGLSSGQPPGPAGLDRAHADGGLLPLPVGLGQRDGGDRLPGGDSGQVVLARLLVVRGQQQLGGHHRAGEERSAQQHPAHLLQDDAQLDEAEPGTAVGFGYRQAVQAELAGHLRPDRGVVAEIGGHQPADVRLGRGTLEKAPDGIAQFFLVLVEVEVHRRVPLRYHQWATSNRLIILLYCHRGKGG